MTKPKLHTDVLAPWTILGWLSIPGTIALAVRLVYEQTYLTWMQGMQMVGFALTHAYSGVFLLLMLSSLGAFLFILAAVFVVPLHLVGQRRIPGKNILQIAMIVTAFACMLCPYAVWVRLSVKIAGPGAFGPQFMVFAAADDDRGTVDLLLDKGLNVDVMNGTSTALNGACAGKRIEMAKYLIARGAKVSRAPECEWIEEISGKHRPKVPGTSIEVRP